MWFSILGAVVAGFILGIGTAFVFRFLQARTAKDLAEELFRESELQRKASLEAVLDNMKSSFGHLSLDVLAKSTDQFLKLAKSKLDAEREASVTELGAKKGLIDQQLVRMNSELENVSKLMKDLEKDRAEKFGELSSQLKLATAQTADLMHTTTTLKEALASTKVRGQWGERMAEDVLRLAGLLEKKPVPSDDEILSRMQGHICRCCGYPNIVKAIRRAAAQARK